MGNELLQAELEAIFDEANHLRRQLTDKANACMQCFTAAGALQSKDPVESIKHILDRRRENLKELDEFLPEYQKLMDDLQKSYEELVETRKKMV